MPDKFVTSRVTGNVTENIPIDAAAAKTLLGITESDVAGLVADLAALAAADNTYSAMQTQTADYTLALTDAGKFVRMNKATAIVLSIPTDAAVAFPVGTRIDGQQVGAGQLTISAVTPGTTTVTSVGATAAGPKTRAQYSSFCAIKIAANSWTVIGDLV